MSKDKILNKRDFLYPAGTEAIEARVSTHIWEEDDYLVEPEQVGEKSIGGVLKIGSGDYAFEWHMFASRDEKFHEALEALHKVRQYVDETIDAVNTAYLKIGGFEKKNK